MKKFCIMFCAIVVVMCAALVAQHTYYQEKLVVEQSPLKGTYLLSKTYFVFDEYGNYCQYSQADGVLDNGTYSAELNEKFSLVSDSGFIHSILLTHDGIDYYPNGTSSPAVYTKIAPYLIFFDISPKEWPEWCQIQNEN